jgi:outer membrane protein
MRRSPLALTPLAFLLALLARPPAVFAESAARVMTLAEAEAFAAAHQPTLLAARARLEAAVQETGVPRGLLLPHLAATVQGLGGSTNNTTASYFTVPGLDLPRIGGTRQAPPSSWSAAPSTLAALGVRQELFDFGRIGALQTVAEAAVQAESARADAERLDVALLVEESFLGVHAAEAVLQAALAAVQRAGLHRDQAAAGVHSGIRPPIELTRAEADLSRFEVGRVRAAGGVDVARAVFAAAVGVPDPALEAGPPEPVRPAPAEAAFEAALARDPAIRAATAFEQQQRALTRAAESELLPELYLSAGLNGRAGGAAATSGGGPKGDGWLPDVPNWDVGVVLVWPLFDAASLARAHASRAREQQRSAELAAAHLRLRTAGREAAETLRVASEALPALERAAQAATANHAQAEARFKAGLGNAVELADAEALRLQGEIELAIGRFEQARARARLSRALSEAL